MFIQQSERQTDKQDGNAGRRCTSLGKMKTKEWWGVVEEWMWYDTSAVQATTKRSIKISDDLTESLKMNVCPLRKDAHDHMLTRNLQLKTTSSRLVLCLSVGRENYGRTSGNTNLKHRFPVLMNGKTLHDGTQSLSSPILFTWHLIYPNPSSDEPPHGMRSSEKSLLVNAARDFRTISINAVVGCGDPVNRTRFIVSS